MKTKLFLFLFAACTLALGDGYGGLGLPPGFTGPLAGDVTGTQGATVVSTIGGQAIGSCTIGQLFYFSGTGTLTCLARGTNGQVLTLSGGVPTWAAATGITALTGDVTASGSGSVAATVAQVGGQAIASLVSGDILYANGNGTLTRLPKGSNTQVLTLAGGVPTWATPSGLTVGNAVGGATANTALYVDNSGNLGSAAGFGLSGLGTATQSWTLGDTSTSTLSIINFKSGSSGRTIFRQFDGANYWDHDHRSADGSLHIDYSGTDAIVITPTGVGAATFSSVAISAPVTLGTGSAGQHTLNTATAAAASCGSIAGAAGCVQITINGTTRYIPYF